MGAPFNFLPGETGGIPDWLLPQLGLRAGLANPTVAALGGGGPLPPPPPMAELGAEAGLPERFSQPPENPVVQALQHGRAEAPGFFGRLGQTLTNKDFLRQGLSNFLFALGAGLSETARTGSGGAGFGAALMAPFQMQAAQRQQQMQEMARMAEQQRASEQERHHRLMERMQMERMDQPEYRTVEGVGLLELRPGKPPQVIQRAEVKAALPHIADHYVNEKGERIIVRQLADGSMEQTSLGKVQERKDTGITPFEALSSDDPRLRARAQEYIQLMRAPTAEPGYYMPLMDNQGNLVSAWNAKTGRMVDVPQPGLRNRPLSPVENVRRAQLSIMLDDLKTIEDLGEKNKDSIGAVAGRYAAAKRLTVGASDEVNTMFRLTDNLADMLLRARSGAQINEQEYARLSRLVPNPRTPEAKFFSDLKSFRNELKRLQERSTGTIATPTEPQRFKFVPGQGIVPK